MEGFREKLNNSAMELKIAAFCGVITFLSVIYRMIDPKLGILINDIAIATLCMSIAVFIYKMIFGKTSFLAILSFASLYVAFIGRLLKIGTLVYGGILAALALVAINAFIWIFFRKKQNSQSQYNDDNSNE